MGHPQAFNKNLDQCHDKVKGLRMAHVAETCSLI